MSQQDSQTQNQRSKIYGEVKQRIIFSRYKQGATLNEKEICEEFGISRTPYREALIMLEAEGLVVIRPKTGVVVSPIDFESLRDVFEMRTILEGVAADLAFKRIQPGHLEALKEVVEKIDALSEEEDIFTYLKLDAEFHGILRDAQGNLVLKDVLSGLYNQCMRLWNAFENQDFITDLIKSSIRDIKKVYEAFLAGDHDAVERLVKEHFTAYLHSLLSHFLGGLGDEPVPRRK
ncbi:MAG: GntR family transcriptional regulator [Deltaproteobacteria bacterium]|nr:GntR family transcriptional regulator [Deltaproteobacteria bacterium]